MSSEKPSLKHIDWLVKNRASNQLTSAKLYRLLRESPDPLKGKDQLGPDAQLLIAVSFSLWRSAFLSDKTGMFSDAIQGAEWFLGEMLVNNAIAYTQDRKAKDWTFNYYANNARILLEDYSRRHSDAEIGKLTYEVGARSPKQRWELFQNGFEKAVEHFGNRLRRAAKNLG